jgi:hypothetical protein
VNIERSLSGAWIVSDIVRGYLVRRLYFGYSKRTAVQLFKKETEGK